MKIPFWSTLFSRRGNHNHLGYSNYRDMLLIFVINAILKLLTSSISHCVLCKYKKGEPLDSCHFQFFHISFFKFSIGYGQILKQYDLTKDQ
jgi:hypothetical protein